MDVARVNPETLELAVTTRSPTWRLTSNMASGDASAIATFYERFFDSMVLNARRLTGADESTCLDIVQDAMLKAVRSIKPIDCPRELAQWNRLLVRSVAYDYLRSESRRRKREQVYAGEHQNRRATALVELEARLAWLQEQIIQMDAKAARMIRLRFRFGWTLQRIGQVMGLRTGAVDGRIRRAVEKLKRRARNSNHET